MSELIWAFCPFLGSLLHLSLFLASPHVSFIVASLSFFLSRYNRMSRFSLLLLAHYKNIGCPTDSSLFVKPLLLNPKPGKEMHQQGPQRPLHYCQTCREDGGKRGGRWGEPGWINQQDRNQEELAGIENMHTDVCGHPQHHSEMFKDPNCSVKLNNFLFYIVLHV